MKESITMKDVFSIPDREQNSSEKGRWTKVGIAFVNRDASINVILDAVPLNGRIQIRDRVKFNPNQQNPNNQEKQNQSQRRPYEK